jgi:hypothetical protein
MQYIELRLTGLLPGYAQSAVPPHQDKAYTSFPSHPLPIPSSNTLSIPSNRLRNPHVSAETATHRLTPIPDHLA